MGPDKIQTSLDRTLLQGPFWQLLKNIECGKRTMVLTLCALLNFELNFYPLSSFAEIDDVDLSQNFPNVLTIHSGNNERLKVGIVLRSGTQKWKQQRATFMGTTEAKSVAAKAKMASFNFKA